MSVLVVVGYGPGISHATAERFAREGYSVALIGRRPERLEQGVSRLIASGAEATAYRADASDAASVRDALSRIRHECGTISAVLWTAFRNGDVTDVLETRAEQIGSVFEVGVAGLLACVQEARADLEATSGVLLVANGALGEPTSDADRWAKELGSDGVALENAAKTKLVGILAERLRPHGVYVGEVTIAGSVAGTATATSDAMAPAEIAETLWSMAQARSATRVRQRPITVGG